MEWGQFAILMLTMIGGIFTFYKFTKSEIETLNQYHRDDQSIMVENMRMMDEKWERLFVRMDDKLIMMDDKWERLFERLLLKDTK